MNARGGVAKQTDPGGVKNDRLPDEQHQTNAKLIQTESSMLVDAASEYRYGAEERAGQWAKGKPGAHSRNCVPVTSGPNAGSCERMPIKDNIVSHVLEKRPTGAPDDT